MRIRFLSDQIYETGGAGKGPRFAKGQVLDETGVQKVLGLADEPSDDFKRAFLHRWLQRGVAEETDGRARVTEPDPLDHDADGKKGGAKEPAEEGDGDEEEGEAVDLEAMTIAQLKEYAEERNIDLGDATRKADIIAAIQLASESN